MIIKSIIILAFLVIIGSLGYALFHLTRHSSEQSSEKTVKALTIRISLSLALFILVFIAFATGLIKPHGIGAQIQMHRLQATEPENTQP